MKDKLLLVGAGGFGRVVLEHAIKEYDCAFVDDGKTVGELIDGVPVNEIVNDILHGIVNIHIKKVLKHMTLQHF